MMREAVREAVEQEAGDMGAALKRYVAWLRAGGPDRARAVTKEILPHLTPTDALVAAAEGVAAEMEWDETRTQAAAAEKLDDRENPTYAARVVRETQKAIINYTIRVFEEETERYRSQT
jgi:hypothetical protein